MPKVLAAAFLLLFASSASAADLRAEIMNAAEHAEYSSEATTLDDARMHLHHSLNCLVGPGGAGFDSHSLNPCRGSGNGILQDNKDTKLASAFEDAAQKVREGLAADDLATAQARATAAARTIVATLKNVK